MSLLTWPSWRKKSDGKKRERERERERERNLSQQNNVYIKKDSTRRKV